jgi:hypothetical protein
MYCFTRILHNLLYTYFVNSCRSSLESLERPLPRLVFLRIDKKSFRVLQILNLLLAEHQVDWKTFRIGNLKNKSTTWRILKALNCTYTGKFFCSVILLR